jgi:hypothetical protein
LMFPHELSPANCNELGKISTAIVFCLQQFPSCSLTSFPALQRDLNSADARRAPRYLLA